VQVVEDVEDACDEQEHEADDHSGDRDLEDRPPEDGHDHRGDDDEDEGGIEPLGAGRPD
jgi:hypothetical protein